MTTKRPVLVVDDNEINQVVVAEELELGGYEAELAGDGREALAKVRAGSYRMILMDCQMPVMDGFVATQEIRMWESARGIARTPIIAVTGHTEDNEKSRALASGMDDFVHKPFTCDDLKRIMAEFPPADGRHSEGPTQAPDLTPGVRRSQKLMELFLKHVPLQLTELREAQKKCSAPEVRAHAHKLKGSCLAIDAQPMARVSEALQRESEVGDLRRADALVTELEARYQVVKRLIEKERVV